MSVLGENTFLFAKHDVSNAKTPQNLLKAEHGNFPFFFCQSHSNSGLTTNHYGSDSLLYFQKQRHYKKKVSHRRI